MQNVKKFGLLGIILVFITMLLLKSCTNENTASDDYLEWPTITTEHKPGTYWWWMGSAVDSVNLKRELESYHKIGMGGTKIIPIYGVKGFEDQYIDFLSPKWIDMVAYTAKLSDSLDMTLDLASGTGWNMGGPWVGFDEANKKLVVDTFQLSGGEQLKEPVIHIQEAYTNLNIPLKEPISANPDLHKRELYRITYERKLPLLSVMAYSSDGEVLKLTDAVDDQGRLNWTAPNGQWELYAIFLGNGRKTVERAAPGGVGWQIDYLAKEPVLLQMNQIEQAFSEAGYEMRDLIRALHDDSYEGEINWTANFFEEFQKLQGYDLQEHIPALFNKGDEEEVKRVRSDYLETISQLFIDNHAKTWADWAHERGLIVTNQSPQGAPAHPLDHWAMADELENTSAFPRNLYSKTAASAANVSGKKIVSQEAATILKGHFQNSLADIINMEIDKVFLNGANKIFYHSSTYSPKGAKWPGWLYYAPVHFVPTNTIWRDLPQLNDYITRVSSFLQTGKSDNDALLYYPIYDEWHQIEKGLAMYSIYTRIPDKLNYTQTLLSQNGYTFDFVSDQQLLATDYKEQKLMTEGNSQYEVIILPHVEYMTLNTLKQLIDLSKKGAIIVFSQGLPNKVPGLACLEEREAELKTLLDEIRRSAEHNELAGKIIIGSGDGVDIIKNMDAYIMREPMVDAGLDFIRRSHENGRHYFIKNNSNEPVDRFIALAGNPQSVIIFDPMSGRKGMGSTRTNENGDKEFFIQVAAGSSLLLRTVNDVIQGEKWKYMEIVGSGKEVLNWEVTFVKGGPSLPSEFSAKSPIYWTKMSEESYEWFSGTVKYKTTFQVTSDHEGLLLDLGQVNHSASVYLNGDKIATLIKAPYTVDISLSIKEGENKLVVEVTNLAANRVRYMEQNGIEREEFYNIGLDFDRYGDLPPASEWPVMESGLNGPVQLMPIKEKFVD